MGDDDLVQRWLPQTLPPLKSYWGNYTTLDRYRDFRTVFGTPEGRRVLKQLIDFCEGSDPRPDDPPQKLAAYVAGKRIIDLVLVTATKPPREA